VSTRDDMMRKFGPKQVEAFGISAFRENNILRAWIMNFKTEVAAATSLSDLQTRIAGLDNLPARTEAQLIDAVDVDIENMENYNWEE
jgi:hypothetical protein